MERNSPLKELIIVRTKEFYREPEAIFWVYIFPIFLMVGLGIAFRAGTQSDIRVDVGTTGPGDKATSILDSSGEFKVEELDLSEAKKKYSTGVIDLIVEPGGGKYRYIYDPSRLGVDGVRLKVNDVLQSAAGRKDPIPTENVLITEPGSRYIDWLIPGLLGMNIMGSGLWGLGFVTVDFRMRKLLKRFFASPMRRSDFLLALLGSRLLFLSTEMAVILGAGYLIFGLTVKGGILALVVIIFLGIVCFGGMGLLVGCRADKIETVSGLLNVVMLPMYLFSGIFFSSERFPQSMQPLIQALPLTQLNNALRAVILEGASLHSLWLPSLILAAVGAASFSLALRWFRWR